MPDFQFGLIPVGPVRAATVALCQRCHLPAKGYAFHADGRYCHPDDPTQEDCYTHELRTRVQILEGLLS